MKALMFGWEFPPFISGGLGTVCQSLTRVLTKKGVEILFVMPKVQGYRETRNNFELLGANDVDLTKMSAKLHRGLSEETIKFLEVNSLLTPY